MLRFAVVAALMLPLAAQAQGYRSLSGTVTYLDRMALPAEAVLLVEMAGFDLRLEAEARIPTDGRQVPIPFSLDIPEGAEGRLRVGLALGTQVVWLGDATQIDVNTPVDIGELVLRRHRPMGFDSAFRCGDDLIRVGPAGPTGPVGEAVVLDTPDARMVLQPVPAASGARYEAEGDPDTFFWSRGDSAQVSLAGTDLPECRVSLPIDETPYRAGGNEPFWSVTIDAGGMRITRLGYDDLALPVADSALSETGDITVIGADPEQAVQATLVRARALCRDTMTGMPHPERVELSLDEATLTGCGGDPLTLLTGRTWVVEDIAGAGVIDNTEPTLVFGTEGRVAGGGSCNRWFAGYTLTGESLTIGDAGATMMACPDAIMAQEQRFFDALSQSTGFDIDDTGALLLRAGDEVILTARGATGP